MNQKKLITVLAVLVLIFGVTTIYFLTAQKSIAPVVQSTPVTSVVQDENANWQTYSNAEYGFEFKYPETWIVVEDGKNGSNYKLIVKIVNPARAGKIDTGAPIEQFIVRSENMVCEGQLPISISNKTGTDSGWNQGYASIYYRDLCFKAHEWPITIGLSAFDDLSQKLMDKILSTFKFTK